jgi:hypothetical protein
MATKQFFIISCHIAYKFCQESQSSSTNATTIRIVFVRVQLTRLSENKIIANFIYDVN